MARRGTGLGGRGVWGSLHPSEPDLSDPGQIYRGTQGLCRRFKQTQGPADAQTALYVWSDKKQIFPKTMEGKKMGWKRGEPLGEEEQYLPGGKWTFDGVYQKIHPL